MDWDLLGDGVVPMFGGISRAWAEVRDCLESPKWIMRHLEDHDRRDGVANNGFNLTRTRLSYSESAWRAGYAKLVRQTDARSVKGPRGFPLPVGRR
jgi:hypothetical protein